MGKADKGTKNTLAFATENSLAYTAGLVVNAMMHAHTNAIARCCYSNVMYYKCKSTPSVGAEVAGLVAEVALTCIAKFRFRQTCQRTCVTKRGSDGEAYTHVCGRMVVQNGAGIVALLHLLYNQEYCAAARYCHV